MLILNVRSVRRLHSLGQISLLLLSAVIANSSAASTSGGWAMAGPVRGREARGPTALQGTSVFSQQQVGGAPISHTLITAHVRCLKRFANFIWVTLSDDEQLSTYLKLSLCNAKEAEGKESTWHAMENNLLVSALQWFIQPTYPGHYRSWSERPQARSLCTLHVRGCHRTGPRLRLKDLPQASRAMWWRSKDKDMWTFCTCGFGAQTPELPELGEIESKTHSLLHKPTHTYHRNL